MGERGVTELGITCPFCDQKLKMETYRMRFRSSPTCTVFCDHETCDTKPSTIDTSPSIAFADVAAWRRGAEEAQRRHPMTQPNEQLDIERIIKVVSGSHMTMEDAENLVPWLRALLEENKRLTIDRECWFELYTQERELSKNQKEYLAQELYQVKAERDTLKSDYEDLVFNVEQGEECKSLRTELSAKNKTLELIMNAPPELSDLWMKDKCRYILSIYPPRREEDET